MDDSNNQNESIARIDASRASDESLIRVHAQIRRNKVAASPVKFFAMVAAVIVASVGFFSVRQNFHQDTYLYDRQEIAAYQAYLASGGADAGPVVIDGAALYAQQCVACHQATGLGLPGAFPPLAGSEWVTTGNGDLVAKILLSGLSGPVVVKGNNYNGAMPAFGAVWDDAHIAAVATYIRSSWDNGAGEVTVEQVAAIRSEHGSRGNWTAAELQSYFE